MLKERLDNVEVKYEPVVQVKPNEIEQIEVKDCMWQSFDGNVANEVAERMKHINAAKSMLMKAKRNEIQF